MTTFDRRLSHVLDGLLGALDALLLAWLATYRVEGPARGAIADALEQSHQHLYGSRLTLEAALVPDNEDVMTDEHEHGRAAFERIAYETSTGIARWIPRRIVEHEQPMHNASEPLSVEQRRARERDRKARQRIKARRPGKRTSADSADD